MRSIRNFFLVLLLVFLSSCGYKAVDFSERRATGKLDKVFCLERIKISFPEAKLTDTLYRYVSSAIISSGYKIECSKNTNRYIKLYVNSINIYPIGYSGSLRASVYKVIIRTNLRVENRKREIILNKDISETTQFLGSGLRADIERRYAMEEIGQFLGLRIFSIITNIENIKNGK